MSSFELRRDTNQVLSFYRVCETQNTALHSKLIQASEVQENTINDDMKVKDDKPKTGSKRKASIDTVGSSKIKRVV